MRPSKAGRTWLFSQVLKRAPFFSIPPFGKKHPDLEKPDHGYRIARLAVDVHDALLALDLRDVTLCGHSMSWAVLWSYWEHFGADRLSKAGPRRPGRDGYRLAGVERRG
jgi:pimeloyl-ACP methyl ester carboxylesterase